MSFEILLPIAKRAPLYLANQREVPWALRPFVSGAFGSGSIPLNEIGHIYGGRAAKPIKPIMIFHPNTNVISFIVGNGDADAAELEDLAMATAESTETKQKNNRFAEYRERMGLPKIEDVRTLRNEALAAHAKRRVAHPSEFPKKPVPDRSWVQRLPDASKMPLWRTN